MAQPGWLNDLVKACVAAGVEEFVVCAGARNLPLVVALSQPQEREIQIYSHFEERAAGFFALGRTMSTGRPCAVVTTSGTAVAELLPAVIEAHYQGRPLLLITADRPQSFRGSGAPQAIEQVGIFDGYVSGVQDLQAGERMNLFENWNLATPWHLNVCIEESELKFNEGTSQAASKVTLGDTLQPKPKLDMRPVLECINDGWRGLVVMLGGLEPQDREEVFHFLKDLNVPVLADATSGLREALGKQIVVDGDRILAEEKPAHILRIGEVPIGRFWRDLESHTKINVVSISRTGFSGLARKSHCITGDITRCLQALGEVAKVGDTQDWLKHSQRRRGGISELLDRFPESEPGMIRQLSVCATIGSSLYLGNSLPVREWGDFAQRDVPYEYVRANRGANGIDGQISTWLGSTVDEEDAWAVIGDLTAMYDLSAPALLSQVEQQGRVLVVINNRGGRIFNRLPAVRALPKKIEHQITNNHSFQLRSWADMWGMDYLRINSNQDFDINPGEKTLLVEIMPDAEQTDAFWQAWEDMANA